jgi:hypothetical protein
MTARHGKTFQDKGLSLALRSAAAAFLSVALVFSAVSGAWAQVVAADPLPPFAPFQKEPRFESSVHIKTFDAAQSVTQGYHELIPKFNSKKEPSGFAEIDYSLGVSLNGRGDVYNSISSLPFGPGGRRFQTITIMGADITAPGKALVGAERFFFSACEGNEQRGCGSAVGLGFNTQLIRGVAVSHVEFDTATQQFNASYLGDGIGAAGIGIAILAGSGDSGATTSSQSYSGSISVEGDSRVRYSASSGPLGGCF